MVASVYPRRFVPQDFNPADLAQVVKQYEYLLRRPINSAPELLEWLTDASELFSVLDEYGSRRYVDKSCHTEDEQL